MNNIEIAKKAVSQAWKEIMKIYNKDYDIKYKDDKSPFTEADKKANEILISYFEKTNIKIFSEEIKDSFKNRKDEEYLWIIDPIDGTKDFINKTWEFSIMVWLVYQNNPILWAIYVPNEDKLYFAEKWKWTYLEQNWNTKNIKIDKSKKQILTSRNHTSNIELDLINKLELENIPCGSIWVKLWLISEWKAWNYINLSNKLWQWDWCWPHIILQEAGWEITDKFWNTIKYNQESTNLENWFIATNWIFHKEILNSINK